MFGVRTRTHTKFFFADLEDIVTILLDFEQGKELWYWESIFQSGLEIIKHESIINFAFNHNTASSDQYISLKEYLIMPKNIAINYREVPQRKGGVYYSIDPFENPNALGIKIGGVYPGRYLVNCYLHLPPNFTEIAVSNFRNMVKVVKNRCQTIDGELVAPGALAKLNDGFKLVTHVGGYALKVL